MRTLRHTLTTAGMFFTALLIFTGRPAAQTLTTLATFSSPLSDGIGPSGVVVASDGALYGATQSGGSTNSGIVFSLTPPTTGGAWTEALIYSFTGGSDGGTPTGLAIGSGPGGSPVLYGTTSAGGAANNGTVFSLTSGPGGAWAESVLYSFTGGSDGGGPSTGVAIGSGTGGSTVLYGTTFAGGTTNNGTVFRLTPPTTPSGTWTEATLYDFPLPMGSYSHGITPSGVVIGSGPGGYLVLYGTTQYGGTGTGLLCSFPPGGCGTVFSLTPPTGVPSGTGGAWTETLLYNFAGGSDGAFPSGVVIGSGGVLYGTAPNGSPSSAGVFFSLTPPSQSGGAWTESVLYSVGSRAGVVIGAGGVLYGLVRSSPVSESYAVVSLTPPTAAPFVTGGAWTESVLYSFTTSGNGLVSGLAIGKDGVLYGATASGGPAAAGTVYSVTPGSGGAWTGSVLYTFTGGSPGSGALTGLAIDIKGVLYGATTGGGAGSCPSGCGTVFSLTPPASTGGAWTKSVLYKFAGGSDGAYPEAGLAIGSGPEGPLVLYGTTYVGGAGPCTLYRYPPGCGTVFSLTPPSSPSGAWTETVLHNFTSGNDGANPNAGVVIGENGVLYGTTQYGGPWSIDALAGALGYGTVFSLTPPTATLFGPEGTWTEAVLYDFELNLTLISFSAGPSGLAIGSGGVLYGTAQFAGLSPMDYLPGCGTVFSLTSGAETDLYSFSPSGDDACGPNAGVVVGAGGVLYGTTKGSGTSFVGAIFSLTPPAPPASAWTETVLSNFTGTGGATPNGVVVGSGSGGYPVLYGTTQAGGSGPCTTPNQYPGCGTVFALIPPATPDGEWAEATLHNFIGGSDGAFPAAGVVISSGVLYGTTTGTNGGTVFALSVGNGPAPSINLGGVVNAASYTAPVAPGSIASAFGNFLLSSPLSATQSPLPDDISGLSLQFGGGTQAPLFFVSSAQVNFQVPWELSNQSQSTLAATWDNAAGAAQTVNVAPVAPAIFSTNASGSGQGAILDTSYRLVDSMNPVAVGNFVLIYCTGLGAVGNQPATGSPAPSDPLAWSATPTVTIGGVPANVQFSGLAPGYVGLYQVNAQVPAGSATGSAVPVVLSMSGVTSNTVTIAVE